MSSDRPPLDGPATDLSYVRKLPIDAWGFTNCPAIPYWADVYGNPDQAHIGLTLQRLAGRLQESLGAYAGLNTQYTIGRQTHYAYEFLYDLPLPGTGDHLMQAPTAPNQVALDAAEQFTLAWTTWESAYQSSQDLVEPFAATLTDPSVATNSFWPTIAAFGLPYNLLVLQKFDETDFPSVAAELGGASGRPRYVIDMGIMASLEPFTERNGTVRFAPGTVTVLEQDDAKRLTPILVQVFTKDSTRTYRQGDAAWLYALQAAKVSITVWGIWLGHVYHWHTVSAAMQMAMFNKLPAGHPLWTLLQPQSQSLIDFDFALLVILFGKIAPPKPVDGYMSLVGLLDTFAEGRAFFADDPLQELQARGITREDFSVEKDWDRYPIVGYLLELYGASRDFVEVVVRDLYSTDGEVAEDVGLQQWLKACRDPSHGNVSLPEIDTVELLVDLLASLLYRVTVHGAGSLSPSVNPALAFVSNFPPCLQRAKIPDPTDELSESDLLALLPHTGTIGGMATFYFTFVYSQPYAPLIPAGGLASDPYWPSNPTCSAALVTFRTRIAAFVDRYAEEWNEALALLRGKPAGSLPLYTRGQVEQWPRSIEI
jgi:hypothetical protein